jgi:hypothetical protein
MEASGQLHASAALILAPNGEEDVWVAESIWTLYRKEKFSLRICLLQYIFNIS